MATGLAWALIVTTAAELLALGMFVLAAEQPCAGCPTQPAVTSQNHPAARTISRMGDRPR